MRQAIESQNAFDGCGGAHQPAVVVHRKGYPAIAACFLYSKAGQGNKLQHLSATKDVYLFATPSASEWRARPIYPSQVLTYESNLALEKIASSIY
jgi:hypothetical protein